MVPGITQSLPTILVVDDTPLNLKLLDAILRTEGFRVLTAMDGQTALRQCASETVDLILLDVMLPGRSGFEVCSDLKRHPRTSDIPVIFVSALDNSESRIAGFEAGGVDYIAKPFCTKEILARVRVHLRLREVAECVARQQRQWFEELRQAQQSILVTPEEVPQGCFAVCYRPLNGVGGDIYDVVPLHGDRMGYFVADVSGHGVGASFLTYAVKALLRQHSSPLYTIEDTMRSMNSALHETLTGGQYVTACYARLSMNRRHLTVVSAGHLPLILASKEGHARLLDGESDPLGVFGSLVFQKREVELQPGDRFYLYTDGLVEDQSLPCGGRKTGIDRLLAACEHRHSMPLEEAIPAIVADAKPEAAAVQDDLLLLGVEVRA